MDDGHMRGIMIYFRKYLARDMAKKLIQNPCEINFQMLELFACMTDDMFYEVMKPILAKMFDGNKEKRETGIEPVPQK